MEMKSLIEAKRIVENVVRVNGGLRKMLYVSRMLEKLDKVYGYSKEFKPVQRAKRKIEITTTEFFENKLDIPSGVYPITNIWIYKDDIYNHLTTFVFRTKPDEEVIVYGEGSYPIPEALHIMDHKTLLYVAVYGEAKAFKKFGVIMDVRIANIYKKNELVIYELHNQVIEILNGFWLSKCEALAWLDTKKRF
ncbi:MAG: hypothetical protein ACO2PO_22205 [Candidatus Calescibacterium sp.]